MVLFGLRIFECLPAAAAMFGLAGADFQMVFLYIGGCSGQFRFKPFERRKFFSWGISMMWKWKTEAARRMSAPAFAAW